jgi:membrane protein implicated in regulation of membrane protease activity
MPWWAWFLFALALFAGELLTPGGFWLIFFGVGSLAVGLAGVAGFELPAWGQWLAFTAISIVTTLLFRKPLLARVERSTGADRPDEVVGEVATPLAPIAAGAVGKAELRGTVWTARNASERELAAGERCRVTRVDGLQIALVPE